MSLFLVIAGYISAGVGALLISMLIDAKYPDFNLGEINDGGLALAIILLWPVSVLGILESIFAEKLGALLKQITRRMKESARK